MRELLRKLRRVKIVFCRSHPMIKVAALCTVVLFSTAALLALNASLISIRDRAEALRIQAIALEQQQQDLQDRIESLGTDEAIQQIAQEELGLVDPDTIIINPQQ